MLSAFCAKVAGETAVQPPTFIQPCAAPCTSMAPSCAHALLLAAAPVEVVVPQVSETAIMGPLALTPENSMTDNMPPALPTPAATRANVPVCVIEIGRASCRE